MTAISPAAPELSKSRFYAVMGVLMLVEVLSSLEHSMVITALPTVTREFKSVAAAGWLVTIFLLAQAATAAIGGRLGDIFGRRRVLFIVVALCGIGSLISALGGSLEAILIGRAIQGASGAILPLCYGMTRELTKTSTAIWIGLLTGAYSFSAAIGYILGGYLADMGNWRYVFYTTTIYAAALLPLILLIVPRTFATTGSRKVDLVGAVVFAPAIAAVLFGISQGAAIGWAAVGSWGFIATGGAALAFWAWYEARHENPLINVRLLKQRPIALGNTCGVLASLGMMQLPLVTMLLLQQPRLAGVGLAVSATVAGFLKLPSNVAALAAAPISGWIADKRSSRAALFAGAVLGALAWTSLYLFHDTVLQVVAGSVLCGFASTMLLAAIPNMVLEGAPLDRSSEVTGMSAVIRAVAAGIGAQVITMLLASSRVQEPGTGAFFPTEDAYKLTFAFVAATAAMIAVLCVLVRSSSRVAARAPVLEPTPRA